MRDGVIKFWSSSDVLLRQLGQERASSIKDYLVDKGQLADDRVYFIDANLARPKAMAGS
jgi:outer membrane protein OmpA-like peptidoglycan-associated protein